MRGKLLTHGVTADRACSSLGRRGTLAASQEIEVGLQPVVTGATSLARQEGGAHDAVQKARPSFP